MVLLITGHNTFYTYIAPWAIEIGGIAPDGVAWLLFAYGAAGAIGLVLGGLFGDRFPRGSVTVAIAGVIASVAALGAFGTSPPAVVAGMVAWSVFFGGLPALLHARVLHSASERIRDLAAASLTTAFNLAIGGGALLGGLLLDNFGLTVLPWVGGRHHRARARLHRRDRSPTRRGASGLSSVRARALRRRGGSRCRGRRA